MPTFSPYLQLEVVNSGRCPSIPISWTYNTDVQKGFKIRTKNSGKTLKREIYQPSKGGIAKKQQQTNKNKKTKNNGKTLKRELFQWSNTGIANLILCLLVKTIHVYIHDKVVSTLFNETPQLPTVDITYMLQSINYLHINKEVSAYILWSIRINWTFNSSISI